MVNDLGLLRRTYTAQSFPNYGNTFFVIVAVATVASAILLMLVKTWASFGFFLVSFLGGGIGTIVILAVSRRQHPAVDAVMLHDNGMLIERDGIKNQIHWHDVEQVYEVHWSSQHHSSLLAMRITLRDKQDIRIATPRFPEDVVMHLADHTQRGVSKVRFPMAMETLGLGGQIDFGAALIRRHELQIGRSRYSWNDLRSAIRDQSIVRVGVDGRFQTTVKLSVELLANERLFRDLANHLIDIAHTQ